MFGLFIVNPGQEPIQFVDAYERKPVVFATGKEAAEACELAARGGLMQAGWEPIKLQPRRIASDAWKARELGRFADGTYRALPWADLPALTLTAEHFAHVSTEDGAKIAYTQDAAKGAGDIQTRVKPGRYLTQFYGDVFDAPTIARMAAEFDNQFGENLTLSFAVTADEIEDVYTSGPSSCMSHSACRYSSDVHPVRVYAAGDLQLAYLEREGKITARALVWPANKVYSRVYGDEVRLCDLLETAGYERGSIEGARLERIEESGGFVMPYIDEADGCQDCGGHLKIGGGRINCGNTNGLSGSGTVCEACGDEVDEDDCRRNDGGEVFCDCCYLDRYSYCERGDEECLSEDMREVICTSRYGTRSRTTQYWGPNAVDRYAFTCEGNGAIYDNEFKVELADGTVWSVDYFEEHGACCEGSGDNVALDDTVQLEDGTTWSKDYFADNGIEIEGRLYDKSDAPETDGEAEEDTTALRATVVRRKFSPTQHLPGQLELPLAGRDAVMVFIGHALGLTHGNVYRVRIESDGMYIYADDDGDFRWRSISEFTARALEVA